ncbi:MAG: hypothetical protein M3Y03_05650, partial [Verrucomicrobiota bacterium]|nr:hypothetical protein [Verrucomicrobiota bacterium]
CNVCHAANPGPGTNKTVTPAQALQESQDFKVPQLRNIYQKVSFTDTPGAISLDGFGFTHDGTDPSIFRFLTRPVFVNFRNDVTRKNNLSAFLMCFETGVAPAVGYTRTVSGLNLNDSATNADWTLLQGQAVAGNADLIVKGTIDGKRHGLVYQPGSNNYKSDQTGLGPFTQTELKAKIQSGDTLSLMGVPPGSGTRMGIDRDLDGELDGDGPPFSTYAQWASYWFTPTEAAISGALADGDDDGLTNLLEYALNSNPKKADGSGAVARQGNALVLNYRKIIGTTDLVYAVEQSADLMTWTPAQTTNQILADDGRLQMISAAVPIATGAKFLRLSVTLASSRTTRR